MFVGPAPGFPGKLYPNFYHGQDDLSKLQSTGCIPAPNPYYTSALRASNRKETAQTQGKSEDLPPPTPYLRSLQPCTHWKHKIKSVALQDVRHRGDLSSLKQHKPCKTLEDTFLPQSTPSIPGSRPPLGSNKTPPQLFFLKNPKRLVHFAWTGSALPPPPGPLWKPREDNRTFSSTSHPGDGVKSGESATP